MKYRVLIVCLWLAVIGFKVIINFNNEKFNFKNDTALFWTESALQYRTAYLIGTYGCISETDQRLQYPEGLQIKARLTVLMEAVSGYLYYLFIPKSIPFHVYLIIFIAVFSSISVFPLYSIASLISGKRSAGFAAALLYAATPAVYTTVTAPGFEYQDFALPLIFIHLYFFIRALKERKGFSESYAFLSGVFLFAAFASWHMTQFYYVLFVIFIALCFLFLPDFNVKPFYLITAAAFLAGILLPSQSSACFILSLSMLLSYSLIITSLTPFKNRLRRRLLFVLFCIFSFFITWYISFVSVPEYRFVYGFMWERIKHLGIGSVNRAQLPWETLVMWVSPFTGPSLYTIIRTMGALLILGGAGFVIGVRRALFDSELAPKLILYFCVVFFPLYLLLIRLDAFFVFFLATASVYLFLINKRAIRFGYIVGIAINIFLLLTAPARIVSPDLNYLLGMIKYLRLNTELDSPVLTSFAYGPTVSTYTARPILLHPKFEAAHITYKIKVFEHRLFQNEEAFYSFCRSYGARYFIYQTDMLLGLNHESMRYRTHNFKVSKNSTAFKMHFQPFSLRHFKLLYSNPHYRIYKVLDRSEKAYSENPEYFRVYDETYFNLSDYGIY